MLLKPAYINVKSGFDQLTLVYVKKNHSRKKKRSHRKRLQRKIGPHTMINRIIIWFTYVGTI